MGDHFAQRMTPRIPSLAEQTFAGECSLYGALCHKSQEDERGWDFFVEFPPVDSAASADSRPAPMTAFVQVKSTQGRELRCRIKLSNALNAAQSDRPWFIVLFWPPTATEKSRFFAIHFWEDLIRRTLRRVREAERDRVPLHKRWLTIHFRSDDEHVELLRWMSEEIAAVQPSYATAKQTLFKSVGYEDGYGTGNLVFGHVSRDEIIESFLGLRAELPVSRVTITSRRFGIESSRPAIDERTATVRITPSPTGECEIRLRGPVSSPALTLSGHFYSPGIPNLTDDEKRFRFSADLFEAIWWPKGKSSFKIKWELDEPKSLQYSENLCTLINWFQTGRVNLQVWLASERVFGADLTMDRSGSVGDWATLGRATRLLRSIAGTDSNPSVSVREISAAVPGISKFQEFVDGCSFQVAFDAPAEPHFAAPDSSLYYAHVKVGKYAFYALVRRPLIERSIGPSKCELTFGLPQRIESYAVLNECGDLPPIFLRDYQRHFSELSNGRVILGFGDILAAQSPSGDESLGSGDSAPVATGPPELA
jgi:hypothetical protein